MTHDTPAPRPRVMLVDDERPVLQALVRALRPLTRGDADPGVAVETFDDPRKALERLLEVHVDVIVSDYRMPQMDGLSFLFEAAAIQPHALRLVLSASSDFEVVREAVNGVGVYRYLAKPWEPAQWVIEIESALARAYALAEDRRLADAMRAQLGELSPAELELRRLEAQEPGITRVQWGPRGEVVIPDVMLPTTW